jgi:hypothetical protein
MYIIIENVYYVGVCLKQGYIINILSYKWHYEVKFLNSKFEYDRRFEFYRRDTVGAFKTMFDEK